MGYRSTVIVGLDKTAYKKAQETTIAVKNIDPWEDKPTEITQEPILYGFEVMKTNDDGSVVLQADDVKWYDGYEGVDVVNKFVEAVADVDDEDNPNFMVGMGEDGEMHSHIGCWWNSVYENHEIGLY